MNQVKVKFLMFSKQNSKLNKANKTLRKSKDKLDIDIISDEERSTFYAMRLINTFTHFNMK